MNQLKNIYYFIISFIIITIVLVSGVIAYFEIQDLLKTNFNLNIGQINSICRKLKESENKELKNFEEVDKLNCNNKIEEAFFLKNNIFNEKFIDSLIKVAFRSKNADNILHFLFINLIEQDNIDVVKLNNYKPNSQNIKFTESEIAAFVDELYKITIKNAYSLKIINGVFNDVLAELNIYNTHIYKNSNIFENSSDLTFVFQFNLKGYFYKILNNYDGNKEISKKIMFYLNTYFPNNIYFSYKINPQYQEVKNKNYQFDIIGINENEKKELFDIVTVICNKLNIRIDTFKVFNYLANIFTSNLVSIFNNSIKNIQDKEIIFNFLEIFREAIYTNYNENFSEDELISVIKCFLGNPFIKDPNVADTNYGFNFNPFENWYQNKNNKEIKYFANKKDVPNDYELIDYLKISEDEIGKWLFLKESRDSQQTTLEKLILNCQDFNDFLTNYVDWGKLCQQIFAGNMDDIKKGSLVITGRMAGALLERLYETQNFQDKEFVKLEQINFVIDKLKHKKFLTTLSVNLKNINQEEINYFNKLYLTILIDIEDNSQYNIEYYINGLNKEESKNVMTVVEKLGYDVTSIISNLQDTTKKIIEKVKFILSPKFNNLENNQFEINIDNIIILCINDGLL